MGEIRAASPGAAGHQARHHRHVADQRPQQYHGLRGRGAAGYRVHYKLEHGPGHQDPVQNRSGGAETGRQHVSSKGMFNDFELQIMNNYLELGSGLTAKEKARRKGMYMYRGDGYADAGEEADMGD